MKVDADELIGVFMRSVLGHSGRKRASKAADFLGGQKGFLTASTLLAGVGLAWGIYRLSAADAMTGQLDIFEGHWDGDRLAMTNLRAGTFVTNQSSGQRFHSRLVITPGTPLTIESAFTPDEGKTWFPPSRQEFVRIE